MTTHAFRKAASIGVIDGPLRGHHREWYVVCPQGELADLGRVKIGEPREGIPWFDHRFFPSEDELLLKLAALGRPRVPPLRRLGPPGPVVHGFVEGEALDERAPAGTRVDEHLLAQIISVFGDLARVRPGTVLAWNIGGTATAGEHTPDFLRSLIRFTREEVHEANLPRFGPLFDRLGIPRSALGQDSRLMSEAARLTGRPFCLLHGDLHRANFIVDRADRLWTIDWELAAVGDPLYDLATHLHLMNYPPDQEDDVKERWLATMSEVLPGAESGFAADLPRYLAYKRAQSVFTDVVRHALAAVRCEGHRRADRLRLTAKTIEDVLVRAGDCLDLAAVPGAGAIESAYADFCSASPEEEASIAVRGDAHGR